MNTILVVTGIGATSLATAMVIKAMVEILDGIAEITEATLTANIILAQATEKAMTDAGKSSQRDMGIY